MSAMGSLVTMLAALTSQSKYHFSVDDRKKRVAEKSMEMLWMPSSSTKDSIATFAHAFRILYSAPQVRLVHCYPTDF